VRTVEELALARVLEQCLDAMEEGETDLDRLMARYPEAAIEIRPLLVIAKSLQSHLARRGVPLTLEFHNQLRDRLREELATRV
jgi:hypothetical protein